MSTYNALPAEPAREPAAPPAEPLNRVTGYTVTYVEPAVTAPTVGVPVSPAVAGHGVWMPAPAPGVGVYPGGPPPPPGAPAQLRSVALPSGEGEGPVFLGATNGHGPMMFTCGQCGFSGLSAVRKERGFAYAMFGMMTFGIGLVLDAAKDTHHHCPRCNNHLAYAKLM